MIFHLHIKLSQKIALCAIFTLALFIVALDTARFVSVLKDPTSIDNILIWNLVECCVVIIVVNAPVLRPLLFKRDFMRGGSIRGGKFLSKVMGRHRRAQSTPWSSSGQSETRQYGHNRRSVNSVIGNPADDGQENEKMRG
jgi:hypothetical protein